MAGTFTAAGEAMALDFMFTATAVTRPTTWYIALHTGANGGAGAANEIVGNGYARQAVTLSRAGNVISNVGLVSWGPDITVNWGSVTDATVWTALTGGVCLAQGTATLAVTYAIGDTATMAPGAFTATLT